MTINNYLFYKINSIAGLNGVWDKVFVFLSNDFGIVLMLVVFIFWYFDRHRETSLIFKDYKQKLKEAVAIVGATIGTWVFVGIIKTLTHIPRPQNVLSDVHKLIIETGFNSFPSGHTAFYTALATAVYLYHKPLGILLYIGAIIIGFSRIVVGVHYPVDIIVGFLFGVIVTLLLHSILKQILKKLN